MQYWSWNSETAREWECVRSRGYRQFVWGRGFFLFGLLWMMICAGIYWFIRTSHPSLQELPIILAASGLATLMGPVSGYRIHQRIWRQTEMGYLEHLRTKAQPSTPPTGGLATQLGDSKGAEGSPSAS